MASVQPVMRQRTLHPNKNIHAFVTQQQSIKRALRQYFWQGGQDTMDISSTQAIDWLPFFLRLDIEFVKALINTKRTWGLRATCIFICADKAVRLT